MGRWDQREKGDRDICLDEEEEGIGNEEERRTFAQDLLYGLCKNHQTGTADKSCIPSRLRMFTFAEANERERERRAFLERKNLEYDRFLWKAKSRFGNVSKNFHAKFRAPACVRTLCTTREGGSRPRRRRSTAPRTCFTRAHFGIDAGSKGIVQCLQSAGDRDG